MVTPVSSWSFRLIERWIAKRAPKRFFDRFKESPAELPPFKEDDLADLSATARKWALEAVTAGSHATTVKHKQWRAAVEGYLACITYVDHEIGRLLDALDRSVYAENTAIVLWSPLSRICQRYSCSLTRMVRLPFFRSDMRKILPD